MNWSGLCFRRIFVFIRTSNGWTFHLRKKNCKSNNRGNHPGDTWVLQKSVEQPDTSHQVEGSGNWSSGDLSLAWCSVIFPPKFGGLIPLMFQKFGWNCTSYSIQVPGEEVSKRKVPARCVAFFESLPWHTHPCHQKKNRSNSWQISSQNMKSQCSRLSQLAWNLTWLLFVDSSSSCELHLLTSDEGHWPPTRRVFRGGINLHYND